MQNSDNVSKSEIQPGKLRKIRNCFLVSLDKKKMIIIIYLKNEENSRHDANFRL